MVQNAGSFLKIEHVVRRERLEKGVIYLHDTDTSTFSPRRERLEKGVIYLHYGQYFR